MTTRIMILAMDKNRGIGNSTSLNGLPWDNKEELQHFKSLTIGHSIVMGTNTYKKILNVQDLNLSEPIKFKNRKIYLLSKNDYKNHNVVKNIIDIKDEVLFICGGLQVYQHALKEGLVDLVYLSKIKNSYECDSFIPEFENSMTKIYQEDKGSFDFEIWRR